MISNPIIRKEVLSTLRTRKAVAMQGVFFLVVAGLFWLLWPADGLQDIDGKRAREIFSMVAVGQLVMVAVFAPAFTAAALTSEKERNTLESLFATALRPWEIAVGKMVGSLAFLFLLVVTGIPALALPLVLGGVGGGQLLAAVGILLLTALYLGMIGLLVSALSHRSYRAIIITYVVVSLVCFLAAMPAWPTSGHLITRVDPGQQALLHTVAALSPLEAMISLVWPGSDYAVAGKGMPAFWKMFLPVSVLLSAGVAAVCLMKLRRGVGPPPRRGKLKVVERGRISARTFMFLVDPRKRKRMIYWWQNPVLMKEFRSRPALQAQWLLRAIALALICSVVLMVLVGVTMQLLVAESLGITRAMALTAAVLIVGLILLLGPAMTAGAMCSDRESGVWDLMRTTRLSSWRIVSGKYQACIVPLLLLSLAMLLVLAGLLLLDRKLWPNVVRICYVVGMTILFVSTAGMFFSSVFSRSSTATAWAYGLVAALGLTTLLVVLGKDLFSRRVLEAAFVCNPITAAMDAAGSPAMQGYNVLVPHLKIFAAAAAAMFLGTVFRAYQLLKAQ